MTRLIVIGPTEGYPDRNAREFALAAERVFHNGHITPDGMPLPTDADLLRAWAGQLLADPAIPVGVALLDDWQSDAACCAVVDLARALGLQVRTVYAWSTRVQARR